MKLENIFKTEYKRLNKEQKKAVDTIEGPVMVIAGPGTGKTKVLTLRIANILRKTDVSPDNILALTFTESGVFSIRKNLVNIIGSIAYRVNIATFHGFCNQIIKDHPEHFGHIIGSKHISIPHQIEIIEKIIVKNNFKLIKPTGNIYHYVFPIIKKISELKKDAVTPERLKKIINEDKKKFKKEFPKPKSKNKNFTERKKIIEKNEELLDVYLKYQNYLRDKHLYDYDDMIIEVLGALSKDNDLLLSLQEQFQYILADEHQDANQAQNKLLELLSGFHSPYPNLFIVGDEKQAIFRFQGASLENFLYFQKLYPRAVLINLFTNYRSSQKILDGAHSLITKGGNVDNKLRKRLVSYNNEKKENPIKIFKFSNQKFEEQFVIEEIEKLIKNGTQPGEIAILYRDNKDAFSFSHLLEKTKIPFIVESEENILDDIDIKKLLSLLFAIYYLGEDEFLIKAMHIDFLNIDEFDIYKLSKLASNKKENIYSMLSSAQFLKESKKSNINNPNLIIDFIKKLKKWKKESQYTPFLSFLEIVVNESGFLDHILKLQDSPQKISKLSDLYTYISDIEKGHDEYFLEDFISYIELQKRYNLKINKRKESILLDAVHLMTAHKSKGLEFKTVFMTYAQDKHWGGRKDRSFFPINYKGVEMLSNSLDDERRLFYVAITRAKKNVYITYSEKDEEGRQKLPSQFIEEIDTSYKEYIDTTKIEQVLNTKTPLYLKKGVGKQLPVQDKKYLNSLFLEQGLSVTAVNNYLECPWKYFYVNLIRIPHIKKYHQMYGTAMHYALEMFFRVYKTGGKANKKTLLNFFEKKLKSYPIQDTLMDKLLEKGKNSLSGYYDTYKNTWNKNFITEFSIKGLPLQKNIILNGKLDKVEFLDEGGVLVTDYKTGKPKTRNFILGKTKKGNGNYKRQIVFYKILLDLLKDKKFKFKEGEIDFIEPDEKGRFKKERFKVSDSEAKELIDVIKKISKEIIDLSFWDKGCGNKDCMYCQLRYSKK